MVIGYIKQVISADTFIAQEEAVFNFSIKQFFYKTETSKG